MPRLVRHRRAPAHYTVKIPPQTRKRKAAEAVLSDKNDNAHATKRHEPSAAPPTPATTGIMDTEDEFMSGMSESEMEFQGEDSDEDLDMASDDGKSFKCHPVLVRY